MMKAGKSLLWISLGLLLLIAGGVVSYLLGLILSFVISGIAAILSFVPGVGVLADILANGRIVLRILITIVMMIYFWSKYEDKTVIKNAKDALKDLSATIKGRDYSKEKEAIKKCSTKIKNTTVDAAEKIKNNIENRHHKDKNSDDVKELEEICENKIEEIETEEVPPVTEE